VARSTKAATATVKAAASSTTVKTAVAGRVTFTVGGRRIGTVALVKGAAKVSLNVPKGATKVVASFTATGTAPVGPRAGR